jgi:glycosyltransferase involved in cell wall biosynthesis
MRISIALATYNGERFLREQLDSLARQSSLPYELVVSDDRSSDGTLGIVEAFAREAPFPVRTHRSDENLGWQENFVRAALRCEGEWIAFCDQDDVWLPDKLKRVSECALQHPEVVMVVHSAALAKENLDLSGGRLPDIRRFRLVPPLHNHPFSTHLGFATCFQRALLRDVPVQLRPCDPNIPDRQLSHDQLITLLANVVGTVAYLPDVLALYRRHAHAATGQTGTGEHHRNLRTLIAGLMKAGNGRYRFHAEIARKHSAFLRSVGEHQPPTKARSYEIAAEFYDSLSQSLVRRADLYRPGQPTLQRFQLLASAVESGAYARIGAGAGLGWRSLLKDIAVTAVQSLTRT